MIKTVKHGRRHSHRTDEEDEAMIMAEIEAMSDSERAYLDAMIAADGLGDVSDVVKLGRNITFRWDPVSVEEFLSEEYYLGLSTTTLYPKLRDDLIELFETPGIREVIMTGSIGYGKTMFGSVAICRILYELSCLNNPQLAYSLSPGSEMVISTISKSLPLARTVLKSAVEDKLKISKYFEEKFAPNRWGGDLTQFPNCIQLGIGSFGSERTLGQNVFSGVMDEANFGAMKGQQIAVTGSGQKTVAQYDLAEKVYAGLVRRIKSRFQRAGGSLPGMMILLSSANTIGSFTDRRIKEAANDPGVFVRDYSTWEVKPPSHYTGEKFKIVVGTSALRSRIVAKKDEPDLNPEWLEREGAHLIDVPMEYLDDFERDLEGSIRDIAGISTHAISLFLHRIETVEEARRENRTHPFSVMEYTYGDPGKFLWGAMSNSGERRLPGGYKETVWKPRRNPQALRYVHIDPSISGDCTGIAMGHVERMVEVVRRDQDGKEYNDIAPYIVIDFMLRVIPPSGEQIFLPDVRRLVYELMEHGFSLVGFSCDSYQSVEMIQQMKTRGVKSEVLSVDATTAAYDSLKSALYEHRIEYYEYEPFEKEVKALEYDQIKGKIDHPKAGSKDVADAVAGVVHGLTERARRMPIAPMAGDVAIDEDEQPDMSWVNPGGLVAVDKNFDAQSFRNDHLPEGMELIYPLLG